MALKKSELYSSLWSSCDELRGGMDASQYKDYVLVLLFIKYVSDKYAGQPFAPITIPEGASFKDMVALKGKSDIGDHNNPTALIAQGNSLTDPKFRDGDALKTFDYVVANPPFSDKRWGTGLDPLNDPHQRFQPFGTPPAKQGDYAYLLHIVRSLKSTGPASHLDARPRQRYAVRVMRLARELKLVPALRTLLTCHRPQRFL